MRWAAVAVIESWGSLAWGTTVYDQVAQSQKKKGGGIKGARDTSAHKVAIKVYSPFIQIGDATLCQLLKAAGFCSENNIEASNMCLFPRRARTHTWSTPLPTLVSKHGDRTAKHLNKDKHHPPKPRSLVHRSLPSQ